jgi:hypothetical protein
MLLDDIIELATDDRKPVSVLLRKCLILGHKLNNERLKAWANQELNGYETQDGLPAYRIVPAGAKAYMSGPFGASISNFPIPSMLLKEQHRDFATTIYLKEPIGSYEELMRSDCEDFQVEWPADLVLYYQRTIRTRNGCCLAQASQSVGKSAFAQVFDAVRNRTLSMALEIRASLGGSDKELDNVSPQAAAKIERTVTTNIYGGVNVIASGQSQVNSTVSQTQNTISAGDKEQLGAALRSTGLPESSVSELSKAIEQDGGSRLGDRVKSWIKENAPKALVGGVKVASSVAQSVLTEYLKQYYGLH